jgi:hypothetical protein
MLFELLLLLLGVLKGPTYLLLRLYFIEDEKELLAVNLND